MQATQCLHGGKRIMQAHAIRQYEFHPCHRGRVIVGYMPFNNVEPVWSDTGTGQDGMRKFNIDVATQTAQDRPGAIFNLPPSVRPTVVHTSLNPICGR